MFGWRLTNNSERKDNPCYQVIIAHYVMNLIGLNFIKIIPTKLGLTQTSDLSLQILVHHLHPTLRLQLSNTVLSLYFYWFFAVSVIKLVPEILFYSCCKNLNSWRDSYLRGDCFLCLKFCPWLSVKSLWCV